MSHIVTFNAELTNIKALRAACHQLGLTIEENTTKTFSERTMTGTAIQLNGWRYPIVVREDGVVEGDNYEGEWGDAKELNRLKQRYQAEHSKSVLRRQGRAVSETVNQDGSILLTVNC